MRPRHARVLVGILTALLAVGAGDGDVDRDGDRDAGDLVLLQRSLAGEVTLDAEQQAAADVGPAVGDVSAPDGTVDAGDLAVLARALAGEVTVGPLPPGVQAPSATELNPLPVTVTAEPGVWVDLFVDGVAEDGGVVDAQGSLVLHAILDDGENALTATATQEGLVSTPSGATLVDYVNTLPKSLDAIHIESGQTVVWTAGDGAPYLLDIQHAARVDAGGRLVLQPGVTVEFQDGGRLAVDGLFEARGEPEARVVLRRQSGACGGSTDWDGIRATGATSNLDLRFVTIAHANTAVWLQAGAAASIVEAEVDVCSTGLRASTGSLLSVVDSAITRSGAQSGTGILVEGAALSELASSSVDNTATAVSVAGGPAGLSGITLTNTQTALELSRGADVSVSACSTLAPGSGRAIKVDNGTQPGASEEENPQLSIQDSNVLASGIGMGILARNFVNGQLHRLDARRNWWGEGDPVAIAELISDITDASLADNQRPTVDFSEYRLGAVATCAPDGTVTDGGAIDSTPSLIGAVGDANFLAADTTYRALGTVVVRPGETLSIPPGVEMRMMPGAEIRVLGELEAAGVEARRVHFASLLDSPNLWDWRGIRFQPGSPGGLLEWVTLEQSPVPVFADQTDIVVRHALIRAFNKPPFSGTEVAGIRLEGVTSATRIEDTVVDNSAASSSVGTGILLVEASPVIQGVTIHDVSTGILMRTSGSPHVTGSEVYNTNAGFWLLPGGEPVYRPQPVVNDSSIHDNTLNVRVDSYFYPGTDILLDFRDNDWGAADTHTAILSSLGGLDQIGPSLNYPRVPIDFSGYTNAQGGSAGPAFSQLIHSVEAPAGSFRPSEGDTFEVRYEVFTPSTVTMTVYAFDDDDRTAPLAMQEATVAPGAQHTFSWDGRDDGGSVLADGAYVFVLDANDGVSEGDYDPPFLLDTTTDSELSGTASFNAARNEPWMGTLSQNDQPGFFKAFVRAGGDTIRTLFGARPLRSGSFDLWWDGLDDSGLPVTGPVTIAVRWEGPGSLNLIALQGSKPCIGGVGSGFCADGVPQIAVKSDPNLIHHSYDQLSEIRYQIDRAATVEVLLLPPGVFDLDHPSVVTVDGPATRQATDGTGYPLVHAATWTPYGAGDGRLVELAGDGVFTFAIRATDATTGSQAVYRGAIQARR